MDAAPSPAVGGTIADDGFAGSSVECHQFEVWEGYGFDNLHHFAGVDGRLERGAGQDRVEFRQAMGADKATMLLTNSSSRMFKAGPLWGCSATAAATRTEVSKYQFLTPDFPVAVLAVLVNGFEEIVAGGQFAGVDQKASLAHKGGSTLRWFERHAFGRLFHFQVAAF